MLNAATLLADHRWAKRKSLRQLGKEMGLPAATVMRLEQGYRPDGDTLLKVVHWLFAENDEPAHRSPAHTKRRTKPR